jgi:hypothetical protein
MSRGAKAVQVILGEGSDETVLWLEYDFEVFALLEDVLDMDLEDILGQLGKTKRLKFVRAVFWAGLTIHQPALTSRAAGELFHKANSERIGPAILEAMAKANPKPEEAAEGETGPQTPAPSAGT